LNGPTIKRIPQRDGTVHYRFTVDIGPHPETGKRRQTVHTLKTLPEAEAALAKLLALTRSGVLILADRRKPSVDGWLTPADLLITGRCTPNCLLAYEVKRRRRQWTDDPSECTCHCGGEFHALFVNVAKPWPATQEATHA
jgi:hypothetical protein